MLKTLQRFFSRSRLAAAGLAVCLAPLALLASGCTEPVTLYHVPGSEVYLAQGRKILILPFMDTRTYVTKGDQNKGDIGAYTRDIFVEALREFNADQVVEIMTPKMPRRTRSLTNAQVAELGREYGADLVVAGQVFSFTDTRAASIPPRAGMFVRIINAHDGSLLFVGDHYRAAGFPGADGGRDLQALFVSARLIEGFLSKIQPAFVAAGDIASIGAFAMLSPQPARQGLLARMFRKKDARPPAAKQFKWRKTAAPRMALGNLYSSEVAGASASREKRDGDGKDDRKRREPGNVPETERYLGMTASFLFSPEQWDEQFVPEVPPMVDFGEDFYQLPAPPPAEIEPPPPLPMPEPDVDVADTAAASDATSEDATEKSTAEAKAGEPGGEEKQPDADATAKAEPAAATEALAMEPAAPPMIAQPPAREDVTPEPEVEPEVAAVAAANTPESEPRAVADAELPPPVIVVEEPPKTPELIVPVGLPQVERHPAEAAACDPEPPAYSQPVYEDVVVDTTPAMVVDELAEIDMARVYPNIIHADTPYPPPAPSAKLSGDDLASDLFSAGGEVWEIGPRPVRIPTPDEFGMTMTPESPDLLATPMDGAPTPDSLIVPYALTYEELQPVDGGYEFTLDPDTLEVIPAPRTSGNPGPQSSTAPVRSGRSVSEQAGRTVSNPAARSEDIAKMSSAGPRPVTKPRKPEAKETRRRPRSQSVKGASVSRTATRLASGPSVPVEAPVVSMPLVAEQPRVFKTVDNQLAADPYAVMQDPTALVAMPIFSNAGGVRILVLPYHERDNPNNLIYNTGGGEVVTTLFGTQLSSMPGVTVMWDASGQATHHALLTRDEAVSMGRMAGADYVVRGQVVEFRRAQSVPSFYSAVISTAVLAAQLFFAEMSGVDVATEIYRVSDGMCVMSRRDRSQQKYVVQAEKTVRRMASAMAEDISAVLSAPWQNPMDPLIDEINPVSILSDPDRD